MRIAFAGNPNSGRRPCTMHLPAGMNVSGTGQALRSKEKKVRSRKVINDGTEELVAVDLPGAYSMSPFTSEESITSGYVKNENPDVIINIVDATNLSRSLFFYHTASGTWSAGSCCAEQKRYCQ